MPLLRAVFRADSTPPAGPDSSSSIGVSAAASPEVNPPLETMMRSGASGARSFTRWSSRRRYSATSGCTYAFATVVDMRSYSRISRAIPDEIDTASCGKRRRMASAIFLLMLIVHVSVKQAYGDGLHVEPLRCCS